MKGKLGASQTLDRSSAAPKLYEKLDNVAAALDTCLAHFGMLMTDGDRRSREQLVESARSIIAEGEHERQT